MAICRYLFDSIQPELTGFKRTSHLQSLRFTEASEKGNRVVLSSANKDVSTEIEDSGLD